MSARIVVDPDGTRWVSVDITEAQMQVLKQPGALSGVTAHLEAAVRRYEERAVDEACAGMMRPTP